MCVYKQGEIWWYELYVEGKRFRSSTLSTDKAVAQRIESEHRESLAHSGVKVSPTLQAMLSPSLGKDWRTDEPPNAERRAIS